MDGVSEKFNNTEPDWCAIHYGWFYRCYGLSANIDEYNKCLLAHDNKLREQIAQEIETMCQYKDSEELGCWEMDNYGDWYRSCTHKEDAAIARGMK